MKKIKILVLAIVLMVGTLGINVLAKDTKLNSTFKHKRSHLKHKKFKGQKSLNSKTHSRPKDPAYR